MTLAWKVTTGLRLMGYSAVGKVLTWLIPKSGKRQIFMTTLIAEIAHLTPNHHELIEQFNHQLKLASHPSALLLQVRMHARVWQGRGVRVNDDPQRFCEEVLDNSPRCLWYADRTTMSQDIQKAWETGQGIRLKRVA